YSIVAWQPPLQPLFGSRKEKHSQLTALLTNSALTYRHLLFLIPQRISFEGARSNSCCSPRDQRLRPLLGFCRDELGGEVNHGVRVSPCRLPHRKARGLASLDKLSGPTCRPRPGPLRGACCRDAAVDRSRPSPTATRGSNSWRIRGNSGGRISGTSDGGGQMWSCRSA